MKKILLIFFTVCLLENAVFAQECVRADYKITLANNGRTKIYDMKFSPYGVWSAKNMKEVSGVFVFRVTDLETDSVIFRYGFNSLYAEWLTTKSAQNSKKVFYGAVRFPKTTKPALIEIFMRNSFGGYDGIFETVFYPDSLDYTGFSSDNSKVKKIIYNGKPSKKINIAVVADGYKSYEADKFFSDAKELASEIFEYEPFKEHKNKFNVTAVLDTSYSGFSYYTFGMQRYLTTENFSAVCTAARAVDWDFVVVLVNAGRYGGSGIYNFYAAVSAQNPLAKEILVHEFGHSFAGLDDEYIGEAVTECIMCTLSEKKFCEKCKKNILHTIFCFF